MATAPVSLSRKMTLTRFRLRAAEVMTRLKAEVRPFEGDTPAKKQSRLKKGSLDPFFFFTQYLPHYFSHRFAPFHYELIELLGRRPDPGKGEVVVPVAVAAPREFAKTTITSFGYVLHQMLYKKRRFVIIASDTQDLASDLTGYIYLELLMNDRILADFGPQVKRGGAVDDVATSSGVRLLARGRGQRIRGLKHRQYRPDLVILDDMENDTNVKNRRLTKDHLGWINEAVYPAVDPGGNLFIIGTILHKKSALATMLGSTEPPYVHYERRLYRALTEDGKSLWPERHPVDKLMRQKALMGAVAFNQEKMNQPMDESGLFQEEWLRHYHPAEVKNLSLTVAGFFDPSVGSGQTSDYKAIITVGLDRREMIYYVLDAFIRRCSLDQALRAVYSRHKERPFTLFGVEDNVFQRLLIGELDRLGRELGVTLPTVGVTHHAAKEVRLTSLSPLIERGVIRFLPGQGDQDLLLEQLTAFPSPAVNDDGPDALEGAVSLLTGRGAPNVY